MQLSDLLPAETSVDKQQALGMLPSGATITVTFHKTPFSDGDGFYIWDVEGEEPSASSDDLYAHLNHTIEDTEAEIWKETGTDPELMDWHLPLSSYGSFAEWVVAAMSIVPVFDTGKPVLNAILAQHKRLVEEMNAQLA